MFRLTQIFFFLPPFFSAADFFATVQLSEVPIYFLLKRAYIPKTTSPFLDGAVGNFFEDIIIFLSIKISPRYGHPAPKL
jgi:hypothetical protein